MQRLIDNGVSESLYLEYKRELVLEKPEDKREFLRDVTAFPNAQGGTIIFGVDEDRETRLPKAIVGVPITTRDELLLRVESIIKDGIDERLPSYEIEALPFREGTCVLMIRIPQSIRQPHMVTADGERRFFMRSNTGKQAMSTAQIRDAVLQTEGLDERIQRFARERIQKWQGQGIRGPIWAMHIIPLLRRPNAVDLTDVKMIAQLQRMRWPTDPNSQRFCLEGYKISRRFKQEVNLSQQITFRDGRVEFLDQSFLTVIPGRWVDGPNLIRVICEVLHDVFELCRGGIAQPPIAIGFS